MADQTPLAADLEREGAVLARYLLGAPASTIPAQVVSRYARGCQRLFAEPAPPRDIALLRFGCRHPLALPCLDAASGLLLPRTMLRQKLILMLAILETVPDYAETFLPAPRPRHLVLAGLVGTGLAVALKTLGGLAILPLARWTR